MPKPFSLRFGRKTKDESKTASSTHQAPDVSLDSRVHPPSSSRSAVTVVSSQERSTDDQAPASEALNKLTVTSAATATASANLWDQAWGALVKDQPELAIPFAKLLFERPNASKFVDGPTERPGLLLHFIDSQLSSIKQKEWRLRLGRTLSIGVRESLERVIGVITTVKDLATQAAALDPVHAGLPVAALCLIVTLVSRDREQAGLLSDGVELVAKLTQRYVAVEAAYLGQQQGDGPNALRGRVLVLYQRILTLQVRICVHLGGNTAQRTARNIFSTSSWGDMIDEIKQADRECVEYFQPLDSVQGQKLSELLRQFQNDLLCEWRTYRSSQEEWYESDKASQCMRALRTIDYESYKNLVSVQAAGTCHWLTEHQKFQSWLTSSSFSCLWLTADPGCGKSVLSRYLVDEYLPSAVDANTTICYYFFKNEGARSSGTNAICSLLHQLFSKTDIAFLLEHIKQSWNANLDKLCGLVEDLWRVFFSAVNDYCVGKLIIVIDALDECLPADRKILLSKIVQMCAITDRPMQLKILLTGRPDSLTEDKLLRSNNAVTAVRLMGEDAEEAEAINTEINGYIESCVDDFKQLRTSRLGHTDDAHLIVEKHLLSVSNRTYLWVALMFEELKRCRGDPIATLEETLRTLPSTVEGEYERTLQRVSKKATARKLLSLVLVAPSPMTATHLFMALQVAETTAKMSELAPLPEEALCKYLRDLSGLFIVFTRLESEEPLSQHQEVKAFFIHETAREFLLRPANGCSLCDPHPGWKHSIDWKDACHEYARSCMLLILLLRKGSAVWACLESYELVDDFDWSLEACFDTLGVEQWARSFYCHPGFSWGPLRHINNNYRAPIRHWPRAFREAGEAAEPSLHLADQICHLYTSLVYAINGLSRYIVGPTSSASSAKPLFIAIGLDIPLLAPGYCQTYVEQLNEADQYNGDTPLTFALGCSSGWLEALAMNENVDPNKISHFGLTTLSIACLNCSSRQVETLLRIPGIDVNQRDAWGTHATALMRAAEVRSRTPVVPLPLLRDVRVHVNLQDDAGDTALHYCCQNRHLLFLQELLRHDDIKPNITNSLGHTPLMTACRREYPLRKRRKCFDDRSDTGCIEALIHHRGLDINWANANAGSALTAAFASYSFALGDETKKTWVDLCRCFEILLSHGGDPSVVSNWGTAPATYMLVRGGCKLFRIFRTHYWLPLALDDSFTDSLASLWNDLDDQGPAGSMYSGTFTLEELAYEGLPRQQPQDGDRAEVTTIPQADEDIVTEAEVHNLDDLTRLGIIEPRFFDMMFDRYRERFPRDGPAREPVGWRPRARSSSWPPPLVRRRPEFRAQGLVKTTRLTDTAL